MLSKAFRIAVKTVVGTIGIVWVVITVLGHTPASHGTTSDCRDRVTWSYDTGG